MNVGISKITKIAKITKLTNCNLEYFVIFVVSLRFAKRKKECLDFSPWQKLQIAPQVQMMDKKEKKTRLSKLCGF